MFDPFWNAFLQRLPSPPADWFFGFWTLAAYSPVLVGVLCVFAWTRDKHAAFGMILLVLLSAMVGHLIKECVQSPRPFQVDPARVELRDVLMRRSLHKDGRSWAMPAQMSYGFPSGHPQAAVCFWGALALWRRRAAVTALAVCVIALTGLSRVYLGAHFVGDVAGGLVLGGVGLGLYAMLVRLSRRPSSLSSPALNTVLVIAVPLGLYWVRPDAAQARAAFFLIGYGMGYLLEKHFVRFAETSAVPPHPARCAVGLAALAVAWFSADAVWLCATAAVAPPHSMTANGLRFLLAGLTASLVAPALFVRMSRTGKSLSHCP
ncbi:MAG: phosphatase PAP2 family protein [Candidatus Sumerlaeia bacterium]|nr:phosphatase PAP2 family protein [Candidatus Sumerlaeia bacterium]